MSNLESSAPELGGSDEFWLFGYGSLIWKPPPFYDRRVPGWIDGYVRRFWQASEDHRGTPSAPGRVVTLLTRSYWSRLGEPDPLPGDSADHRVWGAAYRIPADRVPEVREYLDIREVNGYTIHYAPFYPASAATIEQPETAADPICALLYIGTPENPQFVGPQDPQALAEHIAKSRGPSGPNRDYLLNLELALDELCAGRSGDGHVKDLARRVRALEGSPQGSDHNQEAQGSAATG